MATFRQDHFSTRSEIYFSLTEADVLPRASKHGLDDSITINFAVFDDEYNELNKQLLPGLPCPHDVASTPEGRTCQVVANRWGSSSWKRLLLLHMFANGLYLVYPNVMSNPLKRPRRLPTLPAPTLILTPT